MALSETLNENSERISVMYQFWTYTLLKKKVLVLHTIPFTPALCLLWLTVFLADKPLPCSLGSSTRSPHLCFSASGHLTCTSSPH